MEDLATMFLGADPAQEQFLEEKEQSTKPKPAREGEPEWIPKKPSPTSRDCVPRARLKRKATQTRAMKRETPRKEMKKELEEEEELKNGSEPACSGGDEELPFAKEEEADSVEPVSKAEEPPKPKGTHYIGRKLLP